MTRTTSNFLYWAPRVLGVLLAAFLSVFALDVFGEGRGLLDTLVALVMHLVPAGIVLLVVAVAWRRERVGAALFAGLGVFYIATFWGRFPLSVYFTIAGPLFLIALLFLLSPSNGPKRTV